MSGEFIGKVAVVTGAGSPIGKAVARRLHAEGADVVLGDVVEPCMVETPLVTSAREAGRPMIPKMEAVIPKGRPADVDRVAYLARDEARFVTGQVISVNGGSTML